ncbi:cytochrome b [Agrobacterium sp. rho-13.3]|uniref:cytochrome b n=1 Tax=Agrobacterium sp. rho-13.3 TaxID=3072980 RepID=UPI002A1643B4|nr:cytochrome b [Agrobacterium sp. rho-13.3]MDX8307701.1 cytochrome b [Agrobacterium sp. rho-13.3]
MVRGSVNAYGFFAILLHWLIAVLILGLLALGYVMTRPDTDPALQFSLFQWHKSFGMLVLGLAVLRFLQWGLWPKVAPVPTLGIWERWASLAVHRLLLLLGVLVPLAGWAIASVSPLGIPTFMFNVVVVPHLPLAQSEEAEILWSTVHATLAYTVLGLVAVHALAAIYHHVIRRDEVLLRMLGRRHSPPLEKRP